MIHPTSKQMQYHQMRKKARLDSFFRISRGNDGDAKPDVAGFQAMRIPDHTTRRVSE
jgi:hypothetical protein